MMASQRYASRLKSFQVEMGLEFHGHVKFKFKLNEIGLGIFGWPKSMVFKFKLLARRGRRFRVTIENMKLNSESGLPGCQCQ